MHAGSRSLARAFSPAAAERRTTTPKEARSTPRRACGTPGLLTASLTTSGPGAGKAEKRGEARRPVVMETGCYNLSKGFAVSPRRTAPDIDPDLIGCTKKAASPGALAGLLAVCYWKTVTKK